MPNSKTKHTPGPWINTPVGIKDQNRKLIAQAWCGDTNNSFGNHPSVVYSEMLANANLIAAAPEMLKALNYILMKSTGCGMTKTERLEQIEVIARKAIKLANNEK